MSPVIPPPLRLLPAVLLALGFATSARGGGSQLVAPEIPPVRATSSPALQVIEHFSREAGVEIVECPDRPCLRQAEEACKPAHLYRAFWTIEGTPAFIDYFVVREDRTKKGRSAGHCRVVVLADYTQDYWGRCSLKKEVCPSLAAALSDAPETAGCSPVEVLKELEPCVEPRD